MELNKIYLGDCLEVMKRLPDESIDCVITSPPYWCVRVYGESEKELGKEKDFREYIKKLVNIFLEIKRILKPMGTCWVNLGDTYSGNKIGKTDNKVSDCLKENSKGISKIKQHIQEKSLLQIPNRFAIEMIENNWILRNEIIWYKKM